MIDIFNYFEQFKLLIINVLEPLINYVELAYDGQDIYIAHLTELINSLNINLSVISQQLLDINNLLTIITYILWCIMIILFIYFVFNLFKIIVYGLLKSLHI